MLFKHLIELYELLDSPQASGAIVADYLKAIDPECTVETYPLEGPKGTTDMVRVRIPGAHGKSSGGDAPTIGLLGRLGGLGARPNASDSYPTETAHSPRSPAPQSCSTCTRKATFCLATCS